MKPGEGHPEFGGRHGGLNVANNFPTSEFRNDRPQPASDEFGSERTSISSSTYSDEVDCIEAKLKPLDVPREDSEDELWSLVNLGQHPTPADAPYSTSGSRSGLSFVPTGYRHSPSSLRYSLSKGGFSFGSPRSYQTASSSLASYTTAPISSSGPGFARGTTRYGMPAYEMGGPQRVSAVDWGKVLEPVIDYDDLMRLTDCIIFEASKVAPSHTYAHRDGLKIDVARLMHAMAYNPREAEPNDLTSVIVAAVTATIGLVDKAKQRDLKTAIADHLRQFIISHGKSHSSTTQTKRREVDQIFTSEWLALLKKKGILLDPKDELDWSGRGQHVEYRVLDEEEIPLKAEKILGHSATALVESVMCRRIRLARKRIRCSRRLSKEDAVTEVEHLQRLQHSHVVRVVGTYTLRKDLAILLYPVAEWNLEEFMDDSIDLITSESTSFSHSQPPWEWKMRNQAFKMFFGCLAHTIHFLHSSNVKHMDIKPKNILIRHIGPSGALYDDPAKNYKVYLADFGIARSYQSAAEAETDSPTSYTRTYAAPEVVLQDKRGFAADIFSLGCVFMEMVAIILSRPGKNERHNLQTVRCNEDGDTSYHANIEAVCEWYNQQGLGFFVDFLGSMLFSPFVLTTLPAMIDKSRNERPTSQEIRDCTAPLRCPHCSDGPEPFEAAQPLSE